MAMKPESPKLLHIIIPAATTLLVAIIGLGAAIYQTEKPIQLTEIALTAQAANQTVQAPTLIVQATQTALAPTSAVQTLQAAVAATLAAQPSVLHPTATIQQAVTNPSPIPASPRVSIINKLRLPINIYINTAALGQLDAGATSTFDLPKTPASVQWSVVKQTTVKGTPIGHDMGGTFEDVMDGDEITIDNIVDSQAYFYPILSNTTNTDCDVTINEGWKSEFVTTAIVPANSKNIEYGYYKLFTNSNVTLHCSGTKYWWGEQPDETNPVSLFDDVEKDTGVIYFTLKP